MIVRERMTSAEQAGDATALQLRVAAVGCWYGQRPLAMAAGYAALV